MVFLFSYFFQKRFVQIALLTLIPINAIADNNPEALNKELIPFRHCSLLAEIGLAMADIKVSGHTKSNFSTKFNYSMSIGVNPLSFLEIQGDYVFSTLDMGEGNPTSYMITQTATIDRYRLSARIAFPIKKWDGIYAFSQSAEGLFLSLGIEHDWNSVDYLFKNRLFFSDGRRPIVGEIDKTEYSNRWDPCISLFYSLRLRHLRGYLKFGTEYLQEVHFDFNAQGTSYTETGQPTGEIIDHITVSQNIPLRLFISYELSLW